jgi:hypothetical protein
VVEFGHQPVASAEFWVVALGHQPVAWAESCAKLGHQPVAMDESCEGLWLLADTAAEPVIPASKIAAAARSAARVLFMRKLLMICD